MRGALLLLALLALSGCHRTVPNACADADGGTPVGPALLAFLSRSRAAHHRADAREEARRSSPAPRPSSTRSTFTARCRHAPTPRRCARCSPTLTPATPATSEAGTKTSWRRATTSSRACCSYRRPAISAVICSRCAGSSKNDNPRRWRRTATHGGRRVAAEERALTAFQEAMRIQSAVIRKGKPLVRGGRGWPEPADLEARARASWRAGTDTARLRRGAIVRLRSQAPSR